MEFADYLGNAITEWLGGLLGGAVEKCGELKTAATQKISQMRASPSPTPAISKSITPDRGPVIEQVMSREDRVAEVKNALSSAGLSGVGFAVQCEDLGMDAAVGYEGVGCASQTYNRFAGQSKSMGMGMN